MSTQQLAEQTLELSGRIVEALSAIGYQVIPPPTVVESECEDCDGQGYDPRRDGYQTCPICQGWRYTRRPVVVPGGSL